jgi:hypothetical protein
MVDDLENKIKRIKRRLDTAADYAQRAKRYADSGDSDSASRNIRNAASEIDSALTLVNRIRRELQ